jgi:hypothetical protein
MSGGQTNNDVAESAAERGFCHLLAGTLSQFMVVPTDLGQGRESARRPALSGMAHGLWIACQNHI